MPEPALLRKTYTSAFVLDRGKFSRLLTILEERLPKTGNGAVLRFDLTLQNGKQLLLHSAQDVLALDNSVRNPIVAMELSLPPTEESDVRVSLKFNNERHANIRLGIASQNAKWANELFAELEEQIERTFSLTWVHRYVLAGRQWLQVLMLLAAVVVTFRFVGNILFSEPSVASERAALFQRAQNAKTDSEKLDVLFEDKLRELKPFAPKPKSTTTWIPVLTWRTVFIGLPILIIVVAVVYILAVCYPWAVFAWGDAELRYSELVSRRRSLWTIVVVAVSLGIITNLFVASLPALH